MQLTPNAPALPLAQSLLTTMCPYTQPSKRRVNNSKWKSTTGGWGEPLHGGATTTGPDATHPPTIFQNSGGGQWGGGVQPGVGGGVPPGGRGGGGCSCRGSGGGLAGGHGGVQPGVKGGGVRVRVTELVEPVLVL